MTDRPICGLIGGTQIPDLGALLSDIERAFVHERLDFRRRFGRAHEVILFGSRARGLHRLDSDFDMLFVGNGKRIRTSRLDVLYLPRATIESKAWHGSELAMHIAHYGVWLKGISHWKRHVYVSKSAIERKAGRVMRTFAAIDKSWQFLLHSFKEKHLTRLCAELVRLECLLQGNAVPPTAMLAKRWSDWPPSIQHLEAADLVFQEDEYAQLQRWLSEMAANDSTKGQRRTD